MKEKALQRRNSFLLVLAAFIWGIAFVAQSEGGKFGPYTFNGIRFLLGAAVLCPVLLIMSKKNPDHKEPSPKSRKALITGGIAYSKYVTGELIKLIDYIAPIEIFPGEDELEALAMNALGALSGELPVNIYTAAQPTEVSSLPSLNA